MRSPDGSVGFLFGRRIVEGATQTDRSLGAKASTGLTTVAFQSGLPSGFDPSIWGSDPGINDGFPYLKALLAVY
jgi:hypothetical protein